VRRRKIRLTDEQAVLIGNSLLRMADRYLDAAAYTPGRTDRLALAEQASACVATYRSVIGADGTSRYWDITWKTRDRQIAEIMESVQ
jgi:hypothetical protein